MTIKPLTTPKMAKLDDKKNITPEQKAKNLLNNFLKNDKCKNVTDLVKSFDLDNNSILNSNFNFVTRGISIKKDAFIQTYGAFIQTYGEKLKQITDVNQINTINSGGQLTAKIGDVEAENIGLSGSFFVDTEREGHTFKKIYKTDFLTYFKDYLNKNPGKSLYDMLNEPIKIEKKENFLAHHKVSIVILAIMKKIYINNEEDQKLFNAIGEQLFNDYTGKNTQENIQDSSLFIIKDPRNTKERILGFLHKFEKETIFIKNKIADLVTMVFSNKKKDISKEEYINNVFKLSHIAKDNKSQIKISFLKTEITKYELQLEKEDSGYTRSQIRQQITELNLQIKNLTVFGHEDFIRIMIEGGGKVTNSMQTILDKLSPRWTGFVKNKEFSLVEKEKLFKKLIGETYNDFLNAFDNDMIESVKNFKPILNTDNEKLLETAKKLLDSKEFKTPVKFKTMQDFFGNGSVRVSLEKHFKDYMIVDDVNNIIDYSISKKEFDNLDLSTNKSYSNGVYFVIDDENSETTMYVVNGNYKDHIEESTSLLSTLYAEYIARD